MKTSKTDKIKNYIQHQKWYWGDPEHARSLQRAKYKRYPERIKEINRKWQEKNPEHWKILTNFNSRIYYWGVVKNNPEKAAEFKRAKQEALATLKGKKSI